MRHSYKKSIKNIYKLELLYLKNTLDILIMWYKYLNKLFKFLTSNNDNQNELFIPETT